MFWQREQHVQRKHAEHQELKGDGQCGIGRSWVDSEDREDVRDQAS